MWFLSFHIHHNAAVTLMKDTEVVLHLEEERLTHSKQDRMPFLSLQLIKNYTDHIDYCSYTHLWDENTDPSPYIKYIDFLCNYKVKDIRKAEPHHSLHASCAFYHSNFDEAVVVVLDGAGSDYDYGKENETIFKMVRNSDTPKPQILYQSVVGWDTVRSRKNLSIPKYVNPKQTIGAGMIYAAATQWLGWKGLDCGKTMGLAPYGEEDKNIKPMLTKLGGILSRFGFVNLDLIENVGVVLNPYDYISVGRSLGSDDLSNIKTLGKCEDNEFDKEELERRRRNFAYKVQKEYEEYLIHLCQKALSLSGSKNLVLSGGCALNCVANYKLLKSLPEDVNLYVEPISADCGVSMGAAFNLVSKAYPDKQNDLKIKDLYLGQQMKYDYELNDGETEQQITPQEVAQLLVGGNIVAIAQGRSEAGPRALGNRSILFDPRHPEGKDIVNRVKKREYFRPFAGTVLLEHARDWFDMDRLDESPFMMYAIDVLSEKQKQIPAITHVDGTCRVQTLTKDQNENYYNLIEEFYKLTGVPIVFNTSFNLAGDTIAETMDDALRTLRYSEIEYLYLPEIKKLIKVPNNL
jgi:carbamoyltransferase